MKRKVEIGEIINTHGIKGELKIDLYPGYDLMIDDYEFFFIDEDKYTIEKSRMHKGFLVLKLEEIEDIDTAEKFKNKRIYLYEEELNLAEDEFLIEDLIKYHAYTHSGFLGKIIDVDLEISSQGVFVINGKERGEIMIPLRSEFIQTIDKKNKKILFRNIEGLIE